MTGDRPDDFDDLAGRSRDRALRDAEAMADVDSALAQVRSGAAAPMAAASLSGRRRVVLAAAVLVAVVTVSAVVWLARGNDEQIASSPVTTPTEPTPDETIEPPTTAPSTTESPTTEPPTTEPPTTTPTATASPSTSPTAPPTSALPPSDIITQAEWTSASTEGLWVSRDGTEWNRTAHNQPLTGPALLIDRYVVTQPAVPDGGHDVTSGPIIVIADGRSDEWTPPQPELEDGSGLSGYELVGVAWLDGRPVFLVRQFERLFPESAYDRLLAVDLRDGAVGDIVEFGGWEARTVAAIGGEGGTIIVFRRAGTTNEIRVIDATGSTLFVHELTADADWSLSGDEHGVRAFGFRHGDGGLQLEVVTVDVATLSAEEQLLDIPVDSTEVLPCGWAHFDGRTLTCARDSGPTAVDIDNGNTIPIGGPTDGLISRRVLPPSDS